MKRIEINKKVGKGRVRVSRTSTPNVSTSPAKGVTLNSAHGIRLSKSWGGVQTAFQNKRFILRGRWSTQTDTNVNLSKSGLSLSQKTNFGTLNLTNPNRSSASIFGINFRGKKAAQTVAILTLLEFLLKLLWLIIRLVPLVLRGIVYSLNLIFRLLIFSLNLLVYTTMEGIVMMRNKFWKVEKSHDAKKSSKMK